jgi:hypothetical protein
MCYVTYEADSKPFDLFLFLQNGERIEEALGGVFMSPIACIDYGYA